jgi:DnaJ-class molecular chaperone
LKYHPDQAGNTEATLENFRQIQEAYSVLSKTTTRRSYDIARNIVSAPTYSAAATRGPSVSGDNVIKGAAISRPAGAWTGLREKYRHESWQKLSLSIKKVFILI